MRRFAPLVAAALALACVNNNAGEAVAHESGTPTPAADAAPNREPSATPDEAAPPELPAVEGIHYLEIVTADAAADAELPMIVAIHGLGDTPEGFSALLADFDQPARVIFPRALEPHPPGWSWFPLRARDPDVEAVAEGIAKAADALAPAIAALAEQRPTRGKPIVTGFSQGGILSFTIAVRHGDLIAAAFPVGGWLPPPLMPDADVDPSAAPPMLAFHGDADKAVQYPPTQQAVDALAKAGFAAELRTYEGIGHAIPPHMHADLMDALRQAIANVED